MLFLGVALGAGILAVPRIRPYRLWELLQSAESEADLPKDFSPLHQGSTWLVKVADVITPSVVHIQSERRNGKGKVEETGSGIVMTSPKVPGYYVVTNRHVIEAPCWKTSIFPCKMAVPQPERIWSDKATDIAVLKLQQLISLLQNGATVTGWISVIWYWRWAVPLV